MDHHDHQHMGSGGEEHGTMDHENMHHDTAEHVDRQHVGDHGRTMPEGYDMTGGHDKGAHGHDMPQEHDMNDQDMGGHAQMHHMMNDRPMFATITVAVCHCGAGCLLGDVVGEWLIYGTNASINGRTLWPEFLIDYAFALLFGIIFQYFSIAPMSGEYGPKTLWRAFKADVLSLTFFEIGLFSWMALFQIAIWDWKLEMNNVVYWWMMQVGMFLGHWTAFPINWWLISSGIKEPCA